MDHEFERKDDHEGRMAKSDLLAIAKNAVKLLKMIDEDQELMGWVQEKITIAADHLNNVAQYMDYEVEKRSAINQGPREFEESTQHQVKSELVEQWLNKKYKEQ